MRSYETAKALKYRISRDIEYAFERGAKEQEIYRLVGGRLLQMLDVMELGGSFEDVYNDCMKLAHTELKGPEEETGMNYALSVALVSAIYGLELWRMRQGGATEELAKMKRYATKLAGGEDASGLVINTQGIIGRQEDPSEGEQSAPK